MKDSFYPYEMSRKQFVKQCIDWAVEDRHISSITGMKLDTWLQQQDSMQLRLMIITIVSVAVTVLAIACAVFL